MGQGWCGPIIAEVLRGCGDEGEMAAHDRKGYGLHHVAAAGTALSLWSSEWHRSQRVGKVLWKMEDEVRPMEDSSRGNLKHQLKAAAE